jgi:thiol-disulfide isomerase/thioredoxin
MKITMANYENYNDLLAEGFSIVDFFTDSCGPCKVFAKILEEVAADLPFLNIVKVNLSDFPKLGAELKIDAVPTVIFAKDGKELERVVGLMSADEVMEKISQYYYE